MKPGGGLPDYSRPPVDEVVCGVRFEFLTKLRLTHFGLLWNEFRADFPTVTHAPPLLPDAAKIFVDESTGAPIPRIWFIAQADDYLIQFQGDYFLFNWRKRAGQYPRYREIYPAFKRHLARFLRFVEAENIGPIVPVGFELTYVNHIETEEKADGATQSVFTHLTWNSRSFRFLPKPSSIAWQLVFTLPNESGTLTAKARPAKRKSDDKPLTVLELVAKGTGREGTLKTMDEWFTTAHEWIVRGFADITLPEVQRKIWGLKHGSV